MAVAGVIVGLVTGAMAVSLLLAVALLLGWHIYQLYRLD
ncbi:MAG: hypothetical protein FD130_70, partial [Halothiobacillaceae bacterium]